MKNPPRLVYLRGRQPLAEQTARYLLESAGSRDLACDLVIVPTAAAGRRIRHALGASGGAWSPEFRLPMDALVAGDAQEAKAFERLAAWALSLEKARPGELFPSAEFLEAAAARLRTAAAFIRLEDELAEAGMGPQDLAEKDLPEAGRWREIAALSHRAESLLEAAGLQHPNRRKLEEARSPARTFRKITVACVPDLPTLVVRWLEAMARKGTAVEILAWAPEGVEASWDQWGRPMEVAGPFPSGRSIRAYACVADEVRGILEFFAAAKEPGDYASVLADSELAAELALAVGERGLVAYEPSGVPLSQTRAGRAAQLWKTWCGTKEFASLRTLCEDPAVASWIGEKAGLGISDVLEVLEELSAQCFARTLDQALDIHRPANRPKRQRDAEAFERRKKFLEALKGLPMGGVLPAARGCAQARGAAEVMELWDQVAASQLVPSGMREEVFGAALAEARLYEARPEAASFEIQGWLEAPWQNASRLAISGCSAGVLPALPAPEPFLPDSMRQELGLPSSQSRRLRDACMLACLTASRDPEDFLLTFSRNGPDDSPQLPSELLLQCPGGELPERILSVFQPHGGASARA
ncbi:MAG: hypothetical protein N2322_01075, partial [Terrimicrobiaceae bacterium]|nr:hypothetical protein [Terrimicrobiaceae bacterium]